MEQVHRWLKNNLFDSLPSRCQLCDGQTVGDALLCRGCRQSLPFILQACPVCAIPQTSPCPCGQCQQRHPYFDRALALLHYQPPADGFITRLKYHQELLMARLLGEMMADAIEERLKTPPQTNHPQLIIPVPLHRKRLRQRGYNQALELARPIASRLDIPLRWDLCERMVATPSQSSLAAKARQRNIRGAFRLQKPIEVKHIAIVDDVITTGATVNELAKVLKKAGVKEIEIWAGYRTSLSH